jgi:peptide/nickel transport system permease protein
MLKLIGGRALTIVPTLLLATFMVFVLSHLGPADPAIAFLGENVTTERLAAVREEFGLNDPLVVQYWHWLTDAVQGDLGTSVHTFEPVSTTITRTLPTTAQLVIGGLIFSLAIGLPLGVWAATRANTATDRTISSVSVLGVSVPNFWLALILVSAFSVNRSWFPAIGFTSVTEDFWGGIRHTLLPAFVIATSGIAIVSRQLRGAMIEALSSDYIRTHRAKGIRRSIIVWKHAMRNSGVTLVTVVGLLINTSLGATVILESVFAIPGLGSQVVRAALQKDFPVIQGVVLTFVMIVIITNLLVDIMYRIIDPRIR